MSLASWLRSLGHVAAEASQPDTGPHPARPGEQRFIPLSDMTPADWQLALHQQDSPTAPASASPFRQEPDPNTFSSFPTP